MTEFLQVSKENFPKLIKILGLKNLKCDFCKKRIRKDNFGIIFRGATSCNSLLCQIEAINKIETIKEK